MLFYKSISMLSVSIALVTSCKAKHSDSVLESVAVQPRSNSDKILIYKANAQNIKRYDCADSAAAKNYEKNCEVYPEFVLRSEFRSVAETVGFSEQEADDVLQVLSQNATKEDDEIKSDGAVIETAKIRRLLKQAFEIYTGDGDNTSTTGNSPTNTSGAIKWPNYSQRNNSVEKKLVLDAMRSTYKQYYKPGKGYSQGSTPPSLEVNECLRACPPKWGDLTCHYYSLMPSYSAVVPNVRGCFTRIAKGAVLKGSGKVLTYPEVYDYCVYQDFDAVKGVSPAFDPKLIAANKSKGKKPGVMAWVSDNQDDAFKFVMFASGRPFAFNKAEEQEVINEFWGVDLNGKTLVGGEKKTIQANPRRPIVVPLP